MSNWYILTLSNDEYVAGIHIEANDVQIRNDNIIYADGVKITIEDTILECRKAKE